MTRVRDVRFQRRSALPLSAAIVTANGVRELLAAILLAPVTVRVFAPELPAQPAWPAILRDARIYRIVGNRGEALLILRRADAVSLAAAAFGELEPLHEAPSAIECDALDRIAPQLARAFTSICGDAIRVELEKEAGALTSFFEVQVERPMRVRLGVGLRCEPVEEPRPALSLDDLAEVPIELQVTLEAGMLPAAVIAALKPGDVLPLPSRALHARLRAAGRALASGECGVSGGRYAFALRA